MEGLEVVLRRFGYGGSLDGVARRHTRGRDLSDAKEETQSETVSTSCKSVSEGVMMHQSLVQSRFGLEESTRGGRSLQFGPQRQVGGFREIGGRESATHDFVLHPSVRANDNGPRRHVNVLREGLNVSVHQVRGIETEPLLPSSDARAMSAAPSTSMKSESESRSTYSNESNKVVGRGGTGLGEMGGEEPSKVLRE